MTDSAAGRRRCISRAGGTTWSIADNFARRAADAELGAESLTPIASLDTRLAAWHEMAWPRGSASTGSTWPRTTTSCCAICCCELAPDAVVHFAEQRAAPYSMKSARHKRYTVDNNLNATHNVLAAIVETGLDSHVVHLGTMGVYGYGGRRHEDPGGLPERARSTADDGADVEQEILYPANPGSVYHMTKTPGPAALRVLQQERRGQGHRPAPGDRLGHPDRTRRGSTSG